MSTVILRSGASLRGVKKVTLVSPGGHSGSHSRVKVLFRAPKDDDGDMSDDDIRVRIVRPGTGVVRIGEIDEAGPRKRKQSKALRPVERMVRRVVRREFGIAQVYLARHQRSNRLKKDGWLKDLGKNIKRAFKDSR